MSDVYFDTEDTRASRIIANALLCETEEQAKEYLDEYVAWMMAKRPEYSLEEATKIAKNNLGYLAGYYGPAEMDKINTLFDTTHPIFGR